MNTFQKIAIAFGIVIFFAAGISLQYAKCDWLTDGERIAACMMLSGGSGGTMR